MPEHAWISIEESGLPDMRSKTCWASDGDMVDVARYYDGPHPYSCYPDEAARWEFNGYRVLASAHIITHYMPYWKPDPPRG